MVIILPWPSSTLSPNARKHWSVLAKAKKKYRGDCYFLARNKTALYHRSDEFKNTIESVEASFVFQPPTKRRFDLDNLISRMKAGIDGVADAIGIDDSKWKMSFEIAPPIKGGQVTISLAWRFRKSE